ncbi:unnamed protein product [Vicia faba]|uniref:Uncharacterized protein n=1 Tax=Vicia faba TaxID=3906 RepID=A0AAV0Z4L0_VICFA|nr:unnamed protein product [Vicia faba]
MRNKKQLWKLMDSISDVDSRKKKSPKHFTPHYMDGLLAYVAPYFYSPQEFHQIKHASSIYNKAMEERKGKRKIVFIAPVKKTSSKKVLSRLEKGSSSKKASGSNRASTPPPPPVSVLPVKRLAYSL